jgi:hypothetical protein
MFQATQSGPFSNSNKMIDLQIPEGYMIDMTQSFVQLEATIDLGSNSVGTTVGDLPFVHNLAVVSNVSDNYIPINAELVRNVWLRSAKKGNLEYVPRCNVLAKNMFEMTKSTNQKVSTVDSLYQIKSYSTQKCMSAFTELHKTGIVPSAYVNPRLNIPISQLLSLGALDVFDTGKLGATTLHLELDNLSAFKVIKQQLTTAIDGACNDIGPASTSTLTLTATYDSLELVPFFVGEKVLINYTNPGSPAPASPVVPPFNVNTNAAITNIVYNETTGVVSITTSYNFVALTGTLKYSAITIAESVEVDASLYGSLQILTAQLGLAIIQDPKVQSPDVIDYTTFTTFEKSVNQQVYSEIVEVEPECVNLLACFQDPAGYNKLSNNVNVRSYRIRVDNLDVFDRDINVNNVSNSNYTHDMGYYELLNRLFLNASLPLKNMSCVALARNENNLVDKFNKAELQILLLGCPTPLTAGQKQIQLNINAVDGQQIKNLVLFKQIVKSLKL